MNRSTMMNKGQHKPNKLRRPAIWGQIVITTASLLTAFSVQADEDRGRVKGLMHSFVLEYSKMNPYLQSEQAFDSKEGQKVIKESLDNLANRIKRQPPGEIKNSPGFRITYGLLADHISKTKDVFDRGEKEYARMSIKGIGNLCAGCHLQVPKISQYSAFEFVSEISNKTSVENADFLFTIRRYAESLKIFDQLIREYPANHLDSDQLSQIYRHKLSILSRIYRDPALAEKSLTEDLKNQNIPVDVRQNVSSWIETLKKWKAETPDPAQMKTPQLIAYAEKNIPADLNRKIAPSDPQLLNLLRISGLLYDRLYSESNGDNTQKLLYYLARCERSLSPFFWYSISEIYLKECIIRFPKQSYSKRCYDAYESGMRERYFGKPLPEGVQNSLKALKESL